MSDKVTTVLSAGIHCFCRASEERKDLSAPDSKAAEQVSKSDTRESRKQDFVDLQVKIHQHLSKNWAENDNKIQIHAAFSRAFHRVSAFAQLSYRLIGAQ